MKAIQMEEIISTLSRLECSLQLDRPAHIVFSTSELSKFLSVSPRTLQRWRDKGWLSYSKVGGEIFYRLTDVLEMLDRNKIEAIN